MHRRRGGIPSLSRAHIHTCRLSLSLPHTRAQLCEEAVAEELWIDLASFCRCPTLPSRAGFRRYRFFFDFHSLPPVTVGDSCVFVCPTPLWTVPPPPRVMCVINVRVRGCMCVCVRLNVCLHRCLHSISESRFSSKNFS